MRARTLRLVHRGLGAPSGEDRNRARKMPTTATGLLAASLDDQPRGARVIQHRTQETLDTEDGSRGE